jgi:predicted O-methyltransferase YrrM
MAERFRSVRISLGPDAGRFAYAVGRTIGVRHAVEFGTSFGISTVYLAAAVRDNGGGRVIGSELAESKWQAARANLADAGLADVCDIRLGDALETLRDLPQPIDLVLLDGWKDLYLDILRLVEPSLRPGAVVLADNVNMFKRALAPYLSYVKRDSGRYVSTTLPLGTGMEYSLHIGR